MSSRPSVPAHQPHCSWLRSSCQSRRISSLRAKQLVEKPGHSRRSQVLDQGLRTITALVVLREHVLKPLLAAAAQPTPSGPARPKLGRKPKTWSPIDEHYQTLRLAMRALLHDLHLAAA